MGWLVRDIPGSCIETPDSAILAASFRGSVELRCGELVKETGWTSVEACRPAPLGRDRLIVLWSSSCSILGFLREDVVAALAAPRGFRGARSFFSDSAVVTVGSRFFLGLRTLRPVAGGWSWRVPAVVAGAMLPARDVRAVALPATPKLAAMVVSRWLR